MKNIITSLVLIFTISNISLSQNYFAAAYPDSTNSVQLFLNSYCMGNLQWQIKDTFDLEWTNISGATYNYFPIQADSSIVSGKEFRAKLIIEPDTIPKYSYPFGIKPLSTFEDIAVGDLYDGTFLYYISNDTILGTYPSKYNPVNWGCLDREFRLSDVVKGKEVGMGQANTAEIIANCDEDNFAALQCANLALNGFEDWYLPSLYELQLILKTLVDNDIHHVAEDYTQSFVENPNLSASRIYWSSSSGLTQSTAPTLAVAINNNGGSAISRKPRRNIIPSRQLNESIPKSNICGAILFPNQLNNHISVIESTDTFANVIIEFLGECNNETNFNWNFGQGEIVSGSGKGPFVVNYDFAGFNQIELILAENDCAQEAYYSKPFRLDVFRRLDSSFPDVYNGTVDAIDINNDSYKDVFISGSDTTSLYLNIDGENFEFIETSIPNLADAVSSWADYNNDNLIDLLINGIPEGDTTANTYLFKNTGINTFEKQETDLPNLTNGNLKWFDFNNDGKMDIIMTGRNIEGDIITHLFQGNKTNQFIEVMSNIPGVVNSDIVIDDYNRDNFLDFFLCGIRDSVRVSSIFKNNNGHFDTIQTEFTGIDNGTSVWGDFDNDGRIDLYVGGTFKDITIDEGPGSIWIAVAGTMNNSYYYQNPAGEFIRRDNGLYHQRPLAFTGMDIGDFNNDGLIDILSIGVPSSSWLISGSVAQTADNWVHRSQPTLLTNRGNGFSKSEANLPNGYGTGVNARGRSTAFPYSSMAGRAAHQTLSTFESSSCKLADFNNDGKLDILREGKGRKEQGEHTAIYLSKILKNNIPPSQPTNLSYEKLECNSILFSWDSSTDDHSIESNLTYEVYIGSEPGKSDVFSKMNERRIRNNFFQIDNLDDGEYFWSCRAVDDSKSSSLYAVEQIFSVQCATNTNDIVLDNIDIFPNPFSSQISIEAEKEIEIVYTILDQLGKTFSQGKLIEEKVISTIDMQQGIYYMKLESGGNTRIQKIICIK